MSDSHGRQADVQITITDDMLRAGSIALIRSGALWSETLQDADWASCALTVADVVTAALKAAGLSPQIASDRYPALGKQ